MTDVAMTDSEFDPVPPFMALFDGNTAGYGQHVFDESGACNNWTVTGSPRLETYKAHLEGKKGLGIVPVQPGNTCVFGCIDYDAHHKEGASEVDLIALESKVAKLDLPLMVCRSKSGGAHLWAFFAERVQATECKSLLVTWAKQLGIAKESEIFPKQVYLSDGQIGNTINLPYFDADKTNRFCVFEGAEIGIIEFIKLSNEHLLSKEEIRGILNEGHSDAPPCIERMIRNGVPAGSRNEAMYNVTIYMRRKDPKGYRDAIIDLNSTMLRKPLPIRELRRTISSASNKDYRYRCKESPCRDLCDRDVCLTRTYGIRPDDLFDDDELYGQLIKHRTDPVQWVLTVKGKQVTMNTHVLMEHRRLMEAVADATTTVIPAMKPVEWMRKLSDLMENAIEEDAPQDATVGGALMGKLVEFVRKARLPQDDSDQSKAESRESLHRGQPTAEYTSNGMCVVHFRGKDFIEFLKRTRHGDVRGATIWMTLRRNGVATGKIRVGSSIVSVWSVPVKINDDSQIVPDFDKRTNF